MNHSIETVTTPKGESKIELRVWGRGRKSKQIKRRFKNRKSALDFLDGLKNEKKEAQKAGEFGSTFGQEFEFWKKHQESDFAPGWLANIDTYWKQLREKLETKRLSQLTPTLMKDIERELKFKKNKQKTINNKMGFILAVLNFAVETERIPYNPLGSYSLTKSLPKDIEFWEREQAVSFLSFLNERYPKGTRERWRYSACLTTLNTGVRAGELWAVKPLELRRSFRALRITQQFNRVSKEFAPTKGKKARSVPLNSELLYELDELIKSDSIRERDLIFSLDGNPVDHDVFHDWFDREVKAWGGKRITFHGLRHTAATLMLESGVDVKTLQEIMGHEDIKTTMKYVHLLSANVKRAAEMFNVCPETKLPQLKIVT
jgi:integrase